MTVVEKLRGEWDKQWPEQKLLSQVPFRGDLGRYATWGAVFSDETLYPALKWGALYEMFDGDAQATIARLIKRFASAFFGGPPLPPAFHATGLEPPMSVVDACTATGVYATIDRSTRPEWRAGHLANGGNARPLTEAMLDQADYNIYLRTGRCPDIWVVDRALARDNVELFGRARTTGHHKDVELMAEEWMRPDCLLIGQKAMLEVRYLPSLYGQEIVPGIHVEMLSDGTLLIKAYLAFLVKKPAAFYRIDDIGEFAAIEETDPREAMRARLLAMPGRRDG